MAYARADTSPAAPVSFGLARRVFAIFVVLALLSGALSVSGRLWGHTLSLGGHSEDRTKHEVVIGSDVIVAPSNMIRFSSQRRSGVADRLDLYIHWPTLEGYAADLQHAFNGGGDIVFLSVAERQTSRDMTGRLDPIYSHLIAGRGKRDPKTLLDIYPLSEASGYMGEQLVVGRPTDGSPVFVARCLAPSETEISLAPCERDVFVGRDLAVMIRFPRSILAEWQQFDRTLAAFIGTLVAP